MEEVVLERGNAAPVHRDHERPGQEGDEESEGKADVLQEEGEGAQSGKQLLGEHEQTVDGQQQ